MRSIRTEVDITAAPERVWAVLTETLEGTKLVQSEEFTGVLAPLVHRLTGDVTRAKFEEMNAALKSRVEGGA